MFSEKAVVLVGLMGSGKTRVGMELAKLLNRDFIDSDREIEKAAGMTITEIFDRFGEKEFRNGERKVMQRLLSGAHAVIASGGGAFIQEDVRTLIKQNAISVWLKADIETLVERTSRTNHRPLLQAVDPRQKLQELMDVRYTIYAAADITVTSDGQSPSTMAIRIKDEIAKMECA